MTAILPKTINKILTTKMTNLNEFILHNGYLSQYSTQIEKNIIDNRLLAIIAPTGSGKSSTCFSKKFGKPIYQMLNDKSDNDNHITIMVVTTNLKLGKDINEYSHITAMNGERKLSYYDKKDLIEKLDERVIITNYSYLSQVIKAITNLDFTYSIIFDEAHVLFTQYDMRKTELSIIARQIGNFIDGEGKEVDGKYKSIGCENIVYLTATIEQTCINKDFEILEFIHDIHNQTEINLNIKRYETNRYQRYLQDDIMKLISFNENIKENQTKKQIFVFFNNKKALNNLKTNILKQCKEFGYDTNKDNMITLTSNHTDYAYFNKIKETKSDSISFDSKHELIFTTSISEDSIDFFTDKDIEILYMVGKENLFDVISFKQFVGRFRNSDTINSTMYIRPNTLSKTDDKGNVIDAPFSDFLKLNDSKTIEQQLQGKYEDCYDNEVNLRTDLFSKMNDKARKITKYIKNEEDKKNIIDSYTKGIEDTDKLIDNHWFAGARTYDYCKREVVGISNMILQLERYFGDSIYIDGLDYNVKENRSDESIMDDIDTFYYLNYDEDGDVITDDNNEPILNKYKGNTAENFETEEQVHKFYKLIYKKLYNDYTNKYFYLMDNIDNYLNNNSPLVDYQQYIKDSLTINGEISKENIIWIQYMWIEHFKTLILDFKDRIDIVNRLPFVNINEDDADANDKYNKLSYLFFTELNKKDNDGKIIETYMYESNKSSFVKQLKSVSLYYIVSVALMNDDNISLMKKCAKLKYLEYSSNEIKSIAVWLKYFNKDTKLYNGDNTTPNGYISLQNELEGLKISNIDFTSKTIRTRFMNNICDCYKKTQDGIATIKIKDTKRDYIKRFFEN